jgi:hypothetical protein
MNEIGPEICEFSTRLVVYFVNDWYMFSYITCNLMFVTYSLSVLLTVEGKKSTISDTKPHSAVILHKFVIAVVKISGTVTCHDTGMASI